MNEAAANIPWLPSPEALTRVARYRGCTPEAAQLLIVDAGKDDRVKAWGVIKDRPEGWGSLASSGDCCLAPISLLPPAWNGTIDLAGATIKPPDAPYEITNLQLCCIDLIVAGSLPAPTEKAQRPAAEAIAYWVKGVPLPWKEWQGAGASGGEIEQAEIDLGKAIGADQVRAWGRLSPKGPMEPLPGSDLRLPGFRWRVDPDGHLGTSPPGRLAVFEGRRWYGIEFDSAMVRQTSPRPLTVRAAPTAAAAVRDQAVTAIEPAGTQPRKQPGPTFDPSLVAAVKNRLKEHRPGTGGNEQWERFCDEVRKACRKEATDRGCSDKTIKRIVDALNRQDK